MKKKIHKNIVYLNGMLHKSAKTNVTSVDSIRIPIELKMKNGERAGVSIPKVRIEEIHVWILMNLHMVVMLILITDKTAKTGRKMIFPIRIGTLDQSRKKVW